MTESADQLAERRASSELLLTLVRQVLTNQSNLADSQNKLDTKLTTHMLDETKEIGEAMAKVLKAFPGDDPDGHRRHHEAVIREAEAKAAFWEKMKYELVRWGLIAFLGWAAYSLWHTFLQGPPK